MYKDLGNLQNFCIERYGYKTYMFIQKNINSVFYDLNCLDHSEHSKIINQNDFYKIIPELLDNKYTVVIINWLDIKYMDIIAVHQPAQKQLNLPPLLV